MKQILLIGPSYDCPTDAMIRLGIEALLPEECKIHHFRLNDFKLQSLKDLDDLPTIDAVIQCGSPFIWDGMHNSAKFQNLERIFDYYQDTPKVLAGIGSCFSLTQSIEDSKCLMRPSRDALQRVFGGENISVVVRDFHAFYILESANVFSRYLPCPSYFIEGLSSVDKPKDKLATVIWKDPLTSISKSGWSRNSTIYKDYVKRYVGFLEKHPEAEVYVVADDHGEAEVESALNVGLPKPKVINTSKQALELIRTRIGPMISGRVHMAIPAHVVGSDVELTPMDTRYGTFVIGDSNFWKLKQHIWKGVLNDVIIY